MISREHAMVDAIAGRDEIASAADPTQLGELLFGNISMAPGRTLIVAGDAAGGKVPFESTVIGGASIRYRHAVARFASVDELVRFRQSEPGRVAGRQRILAITAALAAVAVTIWRGSAHPRRS